MMTMKNWIPSFLFIALLPCASFAGGMATGGDAPLLTRPYHYRCELALTRYLGGQPPAVERGTFDLSDQNMSQSQGIFGLQAMIFVAPRDPRAPDSAFDTKLSVFVSFMMQPARPWARFEFNTTQPFENQSIALNGTIDQLPGQPTMTFNAYCVRMQDR